MARAGSREARELEKVKKVFDEAYRASEKTQKKSAESGLKYHISETFSAEIDKALNGSLSVSSQVKARDYTPKNLVKNGVKDLPMLITQNHVKSIIYTESEAKMRGLPVDNHHHYHGLGKDLLVDSIDKMDDPIAIYKQNSDNYLIITELMDGNGNDIIIPVKINGRGNYNEVFIDENQIKTVYGKRNLSKYLAENGFEIIYKKGETALNEGVQFSNISNLSTDSISQTNSNVNTKFSLVSVK